MIYKYMTFIPDLPKDTTYARMTKNYKIIRSVNSGDSYTAAVS